MNIEIAEYSAYLTLPGLNREAVRQIEQAAKELPGNFEVSIGPHHLDFQEAKLVKMPPVEVCLEPSEMELRSASFG